jgi:hypothetical protein
MIGRVAATAALALATAFTACAQAPKTSSDQDRQRMWEHHKELEAGRAAREAEWDRKESDARSRLRESEARVLALARGPLDEFLREPAPRSCQSSNWKSAAAITLNVLAQTAERRIDSNRLRVEGGILLLDIADAARTADCEREARRLYDLVVATFIGSGFTALRQRAEIAIADMRAR